MLAILFLPLAFNAQGKIAFESCGGNNCEIFLINPDGTGLIQLTFNSAQDVMPSVALNGTKIAFSTNRDGNYEIYTMNLD
jgi:TolB protein